MPTTTARRVFTPERFGQWVHLAVGLRRPGPTRDPLRDGRPLNARPLKFDVGLRLDPAELGNWNPGTRSDATPIRHFSGRIDELAAVSPPLTDAEIERLHADGSDSADGHQPDPGSTPIPPADPNPGASQPTRPAPTPERLTTDAPCFPTRNGVFPG